MGLEGHCRRTRRVLARFAGGDPAFPAQALNGSYSYLPPFLALAGLALWARKRGHPGAGRLARAAGLFAVSIAFRTVDLAVCDGWPLGTHAFWHGLNAVVLWLAATGLVAQGRRTA